MDFSLNISSLPRWAVMWGLGAGVFFFCKILTWLVRPAGRASAWRHVCYLLFWPGMDAGAFLYLNPAAAEIPSGREWILAALKTLLGVALFWLVSRAVPQDQDLLRGWCGMIGLIFMLHFGSFHLLSCAFRAAGINARPLMRAPLCAVSLSEFWGRRWNTAFRDLTHRFLFRPLTARIGSRWALFVGFAFSGIVHDAVISIPAGGGYGGPTFFFLLQSAGLFFERSRTGRGLGLSEGVRGSVFTILVLALPLYGLFHPPFVRAVIVPFMKAAGA